MRRVILVIALFLVPAIAMAQGYNQGKAQTWEFSFSSTEFSFGGALGIRYDIAGNSFIKASYNL